jgi:hypothetical protein
MTADGQCRAWAYGVRAADLSAAERTRIFQASGTQEYGRCTMDKTTDSPNYDAALAAALLIRETFSAQRGQAEALIVGRIVFIVLAAMEQAELYRTERIFSSEPSAN